MMFSGFGIYNGYMKSGVAENDKSRVWAKEFRATYPGCLSKTEPWLGFCSFRCHHHR